MRPDGDPSASQIRQTVCLVPSASMVSERSGRGSIEASVATLATWALRSRARVAARVCSKA